MRYLTSEIKRTLKEEQKMVFIAGPRQVGKTTLAKAILAEYGFEKSYFNWDIETHRKAILKKAEDFWRDSIQEGKNPLIVLDEIHKYPRWKRFLKGLYDSTKEEVKIIVTGSGRLDVYQRGGDSLFGRYALYRLNPFTVGEIIGNGKVTPSNPNEIVKLIESQKASSEAKDAFSTLEQFNGFPEPLFSGSKEGLNKWRRQHRQLVIKEDLRDLSQIRELGLIDALIQLLPEKIGSPISLNSLREDLGVAFGTVKTWIEMLSKLYFLFQIPPYSAKLARTLRSEAKVYLFDWSEIENEGSRFENIVALHLLKSVDAWNDIGFGDFALRYVRDKEKREVDFVVVEGKKPFMLVECKSSDESISPHLNYFSERLKPKYVFQVIKNCPSEYVRNKDGIVACSAARFLAQFV